MIDHDARLRPTVFAGSIPELREGVAPEIPAKPGRSRRRVRAVVGAVLLLLFAGALASCAHRRVLAPPRFDLVPYGPVGLVTFTIENAKGSLHEVATRRFQSELFGSQSGLSVLELGESEPLLEELNVARLGPDAARAIGERYNVPAVFFGHLDVSDVTPRASLSNLVHARVSAEVTVDLTIRLLSTENGATLWSNTVRGRDTVGEIGISEGGVFFGADNPDEAYGRLVDYLINEITVDFKPRWVRAR